MTSDFLVDLVDHKERVAKYMRIAANMIHAYVIDPQRTNNEKESLIDIMGIAVHYQNCGIAPFEALQPKGQLADVAANTMAFFATKEAVRYGWLWFTISDLFHRAAVHDNSKFSPEEYDLYDQTFPELQKYAYGSDEFKAAVKLLGPAWKHHCEVNDHHPEHFESGIPGMHCVQLIEMCADWIAASERSQRDIMEGLEINKTRFGIDDQMFPILKNTIVLLKEA